jgi:hypothetical protein
LTAGKTALNVERTVLQHLPLLSQWIAYTNNIQTGIKMVDDFKNSDGEWVRSCTVGGKSHATRAYMLYMSLLDRCKPGGKYQCRNPSYVGCKSEFSDFQHFAEWCHSQIGYCVEDFQLDKDLLGDGKTYSSECCVFLPRKINLLLQKKTRLVNLPQGVSKKYNKFTAAITIDGRVNYLGLFDTQEQAFLAYKITKESEIGKIAGAYVDYIPEHCMLKLLTYSVEP